MIECGRFNRRISIYEWTESENEMGHSITGLIFKRKVWAEIHPLRGKEVLEKNMEEPISTFKITCRFFNGLTEEMYIEYGESQYAIKSICDIDMKHKYYEIIAEINKKKKPKIGVPND